MGVTVGKNCIIAAGAIVTHDIPNGSVAAGVPARVIGSYDEAKAKHKAYCEKYLEKGFREPCTVAEMVKEFPIDFKD